MLLSSFLILCGTALLADADTTSDSCVYYQGVAVGRRYQVYSPNYPLSYPTGIDCRWEAIAPSTYNLILDCSISIPRVSEMRVIFTPFRSNWPIFSFNRGFFLKTSTCSSNMLIKYPYYFTEYFHYKIRDKINYGNAFMSNKLNVKVLCIILSIVLVH